VAVKKKTAAKKAAPKKAAKKSPAKKSPAKKATAKKTVAKKKATKKVVAKKTVAKKKATVKKAAPKKSAKKKTTAKKSTSKFVVPPVPSTGSARVNVSTTPAPAPVREAAAKETSKPTTTSRQGSNGKILLAILVGVVLLAAIVISNSRSEDSDDAPAVSPSIEESMAPEATENPAPEDTAPATDPGATIDPAAATGEAPTRFIGNWKDSSKSVMVITWNAPAGDVTGYTVETRSGMGAWNVVSEVSSMTLSAEFAKTSDTSSTSFRVSAMYADGSFGVAKAFGFAGQFE